MTNDLSDTTTVTRAAGKKDPSEHPVMSYTAVTGYKPMAEALVNRLIAHARTLVQDHDLTAADLIRICQVALDEATEGGHVIEGRHLRSRINEQLSRAERYKEPFSLLVINLTADLDEAAHDSLVDALIERMRETDMLFAFKSKIVLLLPHTPKSGATHLVDRVQALLEGACASGPKISCRSLTFPDPAFSRRAEVLDWTEDQLRD